MPNAGIPLTKAIRALFARLLFVIHGLIAIWRVVSVSKNAIYWSLTLVLVVIFIEGALIIFTRNGNESRWFCVCIFLYLGAVVPSLWLLQLELSPAKRLKRNATVANDMNAAPNPGYKESARLQLGGISVAVQIPIDNDLWLQLLQQTMLVTVILGRWILPKGDISRDQLSQLLLVFLAMGADIVELFDTFKENVVRTDLNLSFIVLGVWTISLMQFPLILTGGRPAGGLPEESNVKQAFKKKSDKKPDSDGRRGSADTVESQPPLPKEKLERMKDNRPDVVQVLSLLTGDMGFWSIITSTFLQDVPYLTTRLYLLIAYKTHSFTMIFFTCKNILVVILQWYRLLVISCEYQQRVRFAAYFRRYYSSIPAETSSEGDHGSPTSQRSRLSQPIPKIAQKIPPKFSRRISMISLMSAVRAANKTKKSARNWKNLPALIKATQTQVLVNPRAPAANKTGRNKTERQSNKTERRSSKTEIRSNKVESRSSKTEIRSSKSEVRSSKSEVRLPMTLEGVVEEEEPMDLDEREEMSESSTSSVFTVDSSDSLSFKGSFTRQQSFGSLSATAAPYYFTYTSGSPPPLGYGYELRKHRSLDNDSGIGFPFWSE